MDAQPHPDKASGAQDRPSARTRKRPDDVDPSAVDGADMAKKTPASNRTTKKTPASNGTTKKTPASNGTTKKTPARKSDQGGGLVLRADQPPADQRDFDDKHLTRETESEEMGKRYAKHRKDLRKNDWHYLIMSMVVFVLGVAVYVAGFVLVSRLLPNLEPRQVIQIVGLACIAGGGGVAGRSAGRAIKQRYDRRRGQASDST